MLQYEPLRDLLLLKATRTEEKSEGGMFIPDQARETLNEGCIVAIGPEAKGALIANEPPPLTVGDTVVFAKHSEWRIEIDGEVYIAVQYQNILLRKKK